MSRAGKEGEVPGTIITLAFSRTERCAPEHESDFRKEENFFTCSRCSTTVSSFGATHPIQYNRVVTGESWWETDLLAVAKDFLATVPAADGKTGTATPAVVLPPLGVREWLVQEQVRSWLVVIFSRADPLRLMEVDLVMQIGKVRSYRCLRVY